MRRLDDHFRHALGAEGNPPGEAVTERPVAAEREHGRPPVRHGRFRGLPVSYHALAESLPGGPSTEDGDPFDPDDAIACLQYEHYVGAADGGGGEDRLRRVYYLFRPLMPRGLQLALQRANARRRLRTVDFPAWPEDATLTRLLEALLAQRMEEAGAEQVPFVGFWPRGKTWAWCLTHDVETVHGQAHIEPMAGAESERELRSSWYFVPELYPVDEGRMDELRARGHEIGVHGLEHSDRLFASRGEFEWRRERINDYARKWGAGGFRSPATYRNPYWLPELDVDYDSSYMDNATLEPQRGGVCSAFPFMLSDRMVELPITLPMDHTLANVLRQDVVDACVSKLGWVQSQHGLALSLFHPDYNTTRHSIERYSALLDRLRADRDGWHALPREVAAWWQRRRRSRIVKGDGEVRIEGPAAAEGAVWWAHRDGDRIRIEPAVT